ncbi:hypothetical protein KAS31_04045 [Candidatus Parcubacteria bacterium]|nr:hypothetical protein [Candidatus Parcubacteria bacterium]
MILESIKDLFGGVDYQFKKITLKYFLKHKSRMSTEKYLKWLKKKNAYYNAMITVQREKGSTVPQFWIDGIGLIESEIEKVKKLRDELGLT